MNEVDLVDLLERISFNESKSDTVIIVNLIDADKSLRINITNKLSVVIDSVTPSSTFVIRNVKIDYKKFIEYLLSKNIGSPEEFENSILRTIDPNGYQFKFEFIPDLNKPKKVKMLVNVNGISVEVLMY